MSKPKFKRWRLFADKKIQGQLLLRLIGYWIVCQFSLIGTIALFSFVTNAEVSIAPILIPALIVSSLLLPVALVDAIVFSNRFAGPMVNFRNSLEKVVRGEEIGDINFRPGDFFHEISEDFNRVNREFIVGNEKVVEPIVESETSSAMPALTMDSNSSLEAQSHV